MSDTISRSMLVTGGAGFIGSHLVEELVRRRAHVTVVDNLSSGHLKNLAAVIDRVDLRRLDLWGDDLRPVLAEQEFEIIFHVAGYAGIPESVREPRQDLERNTLATFNVLEAVRHFAPQTRVIFTSSAAVYGEGSCNPFLEDDPTVPVSPYGVSKLAAERYMDVYARLYGLRTASLRLFPVYGPRLREHVVYDLMRKVHENPRELFIHGDGTQVRDFTHVMSVVDALLLIAERAPLRGEVYNVSAAEPVSIQDLARMICETMGVAPRFVYSGSVLPGVSQRWSADISRLKGLGYEARLGLAQGLADTFAWFRQEMGLPEQTRLSIDPGGGTKPGESSRVNR